MIKTIHGTKNDLFCCFAKTNIIQNSSFREIKFIIVAVHHKKPIIKQKNMRRNEKSKLDDTLVFTVRVCMWCSVQPSHWAGWSSPPVRHAYNTSNYMTLSFHDRKCAPDFNLHKIIWSDNMIFSPALVSAQNIVPRDLQTEFWVTGSPWVYWRQSRKSVNRWRHRGAKCEVCVEIHSLVSV